MFTFAARSAEAVVSWCVLRALSTTTCSSMLWYPFLGAPPPADLELSSMWPKAPEPFVKPSAALLAASPVAPIAPTR